jgi:hypothetical protein
MMMVDELLEKWKGATDKLDAHFLYFEGWTRATVCELPVHERAAKLYAERFRRLAERAERPLTLQELDNVVETTRRRVPTHQAVLRTTQHLEGLAQQCVDHEDIDFVRFVQLAMKRAKRVRGYNDGTESAIIFVCSAIAQFVQDTYY